MSGVSKAKKLTREDELLQQFSNNVTARNSATFYGNAAIVAILPIWLFYRIQQLDLVSNAILFTAVSAVSTYLLAMAYARVQFVTKHKLAQKREQAINREVALEFGDLWLSSWVSTSSAHSRPGSTTSSLSEVQLDSLRSCRQGSRAEGLGSMKNKGSKNG
ncbi:translocon-associated protein subunit gamma isoform X2 [Galendromus occidentalis]|uniref:Translocon-associated protein subunit gamma n=1 Tax=Galendromus occidentalis TaxID=34638 RepID=A0AAJ7PAW8_9ACAR|nr:translocon-associated protein subunit gamma isoform X2 [Galendromus occidentalis]